MGNNIFAIPLAMAFLMMVTGGDTKSPVFIGLAILMLAFIAFVFVGNIVVAIVDAIRSR